MDVSPLRRSLSHVETKITLQVFVAYICLIDQVLAGYMNPYQYHMTSLIRMLLKSMFKIPNYSNYTMNASKNDLTVFPGCIFNRRWEKYKTSITASNRTSLLGKLTMEHLLRIIWRKLTVSQFAIDIVTGRFYIHLSELLHCHCGNHGSFLMSVRKHLMIFVNR